ncbi:hypothetical protein VTH06DRAFT_3061, partial [Thermothelomyces fergusii]
MAGFVPWPSLSAWSEWPWHCELAMLTPLRLDSRAQARNKNPDQAKMNHIITGAAMGAALTTAGVYAPDIILSQFKFTDFTMLQTFLTAAAGS